MTNAAVRAARALRLELDEEARTIADRVYAVAKEPAPSPIPLAVRAPVQSAGEVAAQATCRRLDLPVTEQNVSAIASYLLTVFVTAYVQLTPDVLEEWVRGVAAAKREEERHDDGDAAPGRPDEGPGGAGSESEARERGPLRAGSDQAGREGGAEAAGQVAP